MIRVYIANASPEGLCRSASLEFGGATVKECLGGWVDEGETFIEPSVEVSIAFTGWSVIKTWATRYCAILGESAFLISDGQGSDEIVIVKRSSRFDWSNA